MSKIFLYIDESKDYKNNILYLGGIVTHLGFHAFEKLCQSTVPTGFPYELKGTRLPDRELFMQISKEILPSCEIFVRTFSAAGDYEYIEVLGQLLEVLIQMKNSSMNETHVFADFIRLHEDMRKLEKSLSKKFSNQFRIPIVIEFKNSAQYRSIQFADLAVGIHRREQANKNPAVCASQSESVTSLHTTFRGFDTHSISLFVVQSKLIDGSLYKIHTP